LVNLTIILAPASKLNVPAVKDTVLAAVAAAVVQEP
jgi:hypothetical protein